MKRTAHRRVASAFSPVGKTRFTWTPNTASEAVATKTPKNPPPMRSENQWARTAMRSPSTHHHKTASNVMVSTV